MAENPTANTPMLPPAEKEPVPTSPAPQPAPAVQTSILVTAATPVSAPAPVPAPAPAAVAAPVPVPVPAPEVKSEEPKANYEPGDGDDDENADAEGEDEGDEPEGEEEQSSTLGFKELWERSKMFKIMVVAVAFFVFVALVTVFIELGVLVSKGSDIDTGKSDVNSLSAAYGTCLNTSDANAASIRNITSVLQTVTNNVSVLTATVLSLTYANSNLTADIASTKADTVSANNSIFYWQIGTGVGSAGAVTGGVFAGIGAYNLVTCKSNRETQEAATNTLIDHLKTVSGYRLNYTTMARVGGCSMTKTACYTSAPDEYFSRSKLQSACTGESGYLIEMLNDANVTFGVYFYGTLPTYNDTYLNDSTAFMYIANDGTISSIKAGHGVVMFPSGGNEMIVIGQREISIAESKYAPAWTTTVPGTSFDLGGSAYHSNTGFYTEALTVYKLSISCTKS